MITYPIACGLPATAPGARRKHNRQTHKYAKWLPALAEKVLPNPSEIRLEANKKRPKMKTSGPRNPNIVSKTSLDAPEADSTTSRTTRRPPLAPKLAPKLDPKSNENR